MRKKVMPTQWLQASAQRGVAFRRAGEIQFLKFNPYGMPSCKVEPKIAFSAAC